MISAQPGCLQSKTLSGFVSARRRQSPQSAAFLSARWAARAAPYPGRHCRQPTLLTIVATRSMPSIA